LPRCAVVDIKEGSVRPPKLDHPPFIETLFPINNQVLENYFFSQGTTLTIADPHHPSMNNLRKVYICGTQTPLPHQSFREWCFEWRRRN
jgi:hypothetical protein